MNDTTPSKVNLSLGEVQIDFEDFLDFRSGMEINCLLPSEFKARLLYEGKSFAAVLVSIQGDSLIMKVQSTDNEEKSF